MSSAAAVEEHFGVELDLAAIGRAADKPQLLVRQHRGLCQVEVSIAEPTPQLIG